MAGQANVHVFTITFDYIAREIITPVYVTTAFFPEDKEKPKNPIELKALWDTGATGSVIKKNIVETLQLKPTGMARVHTASGDDDQRTYLIGIGLPNKVMFNQVRVTEAPLVGNFDILIGMDIINNGDLAITNCNGKTIFSFRIPSVAVTDFVKEQEAIDALKMKTGRNALCPCGSGKKYKHCHGKN